MAGVATTLTSWNGGRIRVTKPPRATITRLARGATLGQPHDAAQQQRVLEATLALLREDAPVPLLTLNESTE
jgi:hypothetical protein